MLKYIIGGLLFAASVEIIMVVPHRLANFTIDIFELIKPGIWYSNMRSKRTNEIKYRITNLYGVIVFMIVVWCMLNYIYPFLASLVS